MKLPKTKSDIYPKNLKISFEKMSKVAKNLQYATTSNSILFNGDSLETLKLIEDNSIDLVLTDPPYHSTQKKIFMVILALLMTRSS